MASEQLFIIWLTRVDSSQSQACSLLHRGPPSPCDYPSHSQVLLLRFFLIIFIRLLIQDHAYWEFSSFLSSSQATHHVNWGGTCCHYYLYQLFACASCTCLDYLSWPDDHLYGSSHRVLMLRALLVESATRAQGHNFTYHHHKMAVHRVQYNYCSCLWKDY